MTTLPHEAPTSNDDFIHFRRQLEDQLREREALIAELGPIAAPHHDPVAWSTSQSAHRVITQIGTALHRIETGTFGVCSRCGNPIATARLEIVPYAPTCVPCQE
jgi:DnaK suppressor protein